MVTVLSQCIHAGVLVFAESVAILGALATLILGLMCRSENALTGQLESIATGTSRWLQGTVSF